MRRLVVEWPINDAIKRIKDREIEKIKKTGTDDNSKFIRKVQSTEIGRLETLKKIRTFQILHILRFDSSEVAAIFRLEAKDESLKVEELLKSLIDNFKIECRLLEQHRGACIFFIKGKPPKSSSGTSAGKGIYPLLPFEVRDGKVRVTLVGDNEQVKEFLERIDVLQIKYRVVLLADASFSPTSPLSQLTEKQREILIAAYKWGYYDIPRKITSEELANKLNLVDSTVVEHLRKAEQRLITQILEQ